MSVRRGGGRRKGKYGFCFLLYFAPPRITEGIKSAVQNRSVRLCPKSKGKVARCGELKFAEDTTIVEVSCGDDAMGVMWGGGVKMDRVKNTIHTKNIRNE